MPDIKPALIYSADAVAALERARDSWNRTQLEAHLDTAERFIAAMRAGLKVGAEA